MIHVLAFIEVKEAHLDEFIRIFKANVPNVLREDGCIDYAPTVDIACGIPRQALAPTVVTIIEKWDSLDALRAHMKTPHMISYGEAVKDMVETVELRILQAA